MAQFGFWKLAEEAPQHVALITPEGRSITAGELLGSVNQLVHGWRALGLTRGDTVAVVLPNCAALVEVCLAAQQAGIYYTPISGALTAPELAYIFENSEAKAIICDARFAEACGKAADEAHIPPAARFSVGAITGFRDYQALKDGQPATAPADRSAGLIMNYTSGTTGRPKGVRRPLAPATVPPEAIAESYASFLLMFGIKPREGVHLVVSPLYHTAVMSFALNHLHLGHTIVLMEKWTPEDMLALVEKYRVTNSHMVPTHFNRLLALSDEIKKKYDLSSLRHVIHSAAPCPVHVKHRMLDWWGPVIYEYYSASEGGGTMATPTDWLAHPGTVGNPWPISQIRILDEAGQPVAAGQVGTVYIHMGPHTFEYHKDKQKTESAWKEGFFTVGDAGYLNEAGFLFLVDRKADMIISGGVNIYPAEIESALVAHPKVGDVAVFGIPDEDWGERVKAVIEPAEGIAPSEALAEELLAFCKERLAPYKIPRSIDFTSQLPRDPNGKLYKRKLRDPYWVGRERFI